MNELVPFRFQDVSLREACWMNGKPYFTRRAIGEWLEYADPQKAIDKIIERNPHLTNPRWCTTVRLTVVQNHGSGTEYKREMVTDAFDPIGLQLIVFESRQPKAIQYKIAVAHLVWAYMNGELVPAAPPKQKLLMIAQQLEEAKGLPRGERLDAMVEIAERAGKSRATVYRWRLRVEKEGELVFRQAEGARKRIETHFCPTWRAVLDALSRGGKCVDVAREFGVHICTVSRIKHHYAAKLEGTCKKDHDLSS